MNTEMDTPVNQVTKMSIKELGEKIINKINVLDKEKDISELEPVGLEVVNRDEIV